MAVIAYPSYAYGPNSEPVLTRTVAEAVTLPASYERAPAPPITRGPLVPLHTVISVSKPGSLKLKMMPGAVPLLTTT